MKFFSSKISTQTVSLKDALENAKNAPKVRSIDEIIASTKALKTAAASSPIIKTASVQVKVAKEEVEEVEEDEDKKDEGDGKFNFLEFIKKKKEEKKEASSNQTVKLAMKSDLDFRGWTAEKVVGAWGAAGNMANCVASVKGLTNNPSMYCGLLQVAAKTADKVIKSAASARTEKVATAPAFKKLAKLSEKERSRVYNYWKDQYGEKYAKAMLENYY